MRTIQTIIALAFGLCLMLIAAANMGEVDLHLIPEALLGNAFFALRGIPLALVIILAVLAGIILGLLIEYARERRHRKNLDQKRREIARLREENAQLSAKLGEEADDLKLLAS